MLTNGYFEKFMRANAGDFRQRYEGTYGFYRAPGKPRFLARLTNIGEDEVCFIDARSVEYRLFADTSEELGFEFLPPKSAVYNTEKGAVFVQRSAQRQFQRGISERNISMFLLNAKGFSPQTVNFTNLSAVYENALPLAEAFRRFVEDPKGRSFALSNFFSLSGGTARMLDEVIGTYSYADKRFTFKLTEPDMWRTEIRDATSLIGCSTEITTYEKDGS